MQRPHFLEQRFEFLFRASTPSDFQHHHLSRRQDPSLLCVFDVLHEVLIRTTCKTLNPCRGIDQEIHYDNSRVFRSLRGVIPNPFPMRWSNRC